MLIEDLLSALGERIGLPGLALDPTSRTCRLLVGEDMVVDIEVPPGGDAFFVHAAVAPLSASAPAGTFAGFLAANLFGRETDEASLGWDERQGELVLFRRMGLADTDPDRLVTAIEQFIATLAHLRRHNADAAAPAPGAELPLSTFIRG